MGGPGLLEDAGDDLLERRLLHAHVGHRMAVEDRRQHLGDLARSTLMSAHGPSRRTTSPNRSRSSGASPSNWSFTSLVSLNRSTIPASGPS